MRETTPEFDAAMVADVRRPAFLFELQLAATTLRLWDGGIELPWGDLTFQGNGWFQNFDPPAETEDIRAEGFQVVLTSIPPEVLALILNERRRGLYGKLWFALLDETFRIIPDPVLVSSARFDLASTLDSDESGTVTLRYESEFVNLDKPAERRFTDGEQQRRYPGDRGFQYTATIPDQEFFWGTKADIPRG
jgi:hypothetical protein